MVITVFRSRGRAGAEAELERLGARMYELATQMPGFISYEEFTGGDGESLSLVRFESHETLGAWRRHPEHVAAQAAARDRLFSEYCVSVCELVRESRFP